MENACSRLTGPRVFLSSGTAAVRMEVSPKHTILPQLLFCFSLSSRAREVLGHNMISKPRRPIIFPAGIMLSLGWELSHWLHLTGKRALRQTNILIRPGTHINPLTAATTWAWNIHCFLATLRPSSLVLRVLAQQQGRFLLAANTHEPLSLQRQIRVPIPHPHLAILFRHLETLH
jgi:hypothetical protein